MRLLAMALVLIGIAGIGLGVMTMVGGMSGANGQPFWLENYGGPGPIIGGLILVFGGLYLGTLKVRRD